MADADDFDVEYFRNLLKGNAPPERPAPASAPAPPVAPKQPQRPGRATSGKSKGAPAGGRKQPAAGAKSGKKARASGR